MALWQEQNGDQFDDGDTKKPGEDSFTRAKAEAHFGHKKFDYLGTPNWQPPEVPAPIEE